MVPPLYVKVGQTITYEGYADDYGRAIVAMEFSFDDWKTWVSHDTSDTNPDLMVHWTYSFTPRAPGTYELKVRAVRVDGAHSPLAAVGLVFAEE